MDWEQLSFLNQDYHYGWHPFDPHSDFEDEGYSENLDSSFPKNPIQPIESIQKPSCRQQVLERILRRVSQSSIPGKAYVEQYVRHKYRRNCKESTLSLTATSLVQFLSLFRSSGKMHLDQLTREDIEAFVEYNQDRGLMINTVRSRLCAVYAFIRFLIENKVVGYELLERKIRLRLPDQLPRAIDPEDLKLLLSVIDRIRDRAMILLLLRTGMRIGELLNTKVNEVDLRQQKILIYQSDKTSVGRVVYYSEDAQQALLAWLKVRDNFKEYLFYGQGHRPLCYETARSMFKKCLQKAGLEYSGYTMHCLRHTFATDLLNARMPLECLRVLLGHTSLEVTRRYARLSDKTREEEYFNAMERILKGEPDADDQCDC
jgi:site-specific recombinase XerD